jgi:uncharacterized NAD(P)/FAD-binding protein YdhS
MIQFDAVVIGGGFSGCAIAAHLAAHAPHDFSLALFEPDELGRGAAYGTRHPEHLLNTRAHMMSIYADEPDHFVRWLGSRGRPESFVSRRLYGDYVGEVAQRAFERRRFRLVPDRVRTARRDERGGFVVESARGTRVQTRAGVLATGNALPSGAALPRDVLLHPGYVADPWRFDYRSVGGRVLVVGSGLTALDVLVALDACGHRSRVDIVSRHGRYPAVHAEVAPCDVIPALDTRDARALLRSFRRHVEQAKRRGIDWRSVVDAIRPEAEATWRRLPPVEQRRFERHLRPHWERHRHRAPARVEAVREKYERSGRLRVHAGRLVDLQRSDATIRLRSGDTTILNPDWIVNCSGVGGVAAMARQPLLGWMLADGLVSAEPQGLGFRVNRNLEAIGSSGAPTQGLWIVGSPVRGSRFEATAVPELRVMAANVAAAIAEDADVEVRLA